MQFRLSTLFLLTLVIATSLAMAGPWGIVLGAYTLLLVASLREALSSRSDVGCSVALLLLLFPCVAMLLPNVGSHGPSPRTESSNNLKNHDAILCS